MRSGRIWRRALVALALLGTGGLMPAQIVRAQVRSAKLVMPVKLLMQRASDAALDKLSAPGAFQGDPAIAIALPGAGNSTASTVLKVGDALGVTGELTRRMNEAAGIAAQEARPIFRTAIDNFRLSDAPGLLTQRDGGTLYLKRKSGDQIRTKTRPMVASALGRAGAFDQLDKIDKLGAAGAMLAGAGLTRDKLTDLVTDQALKGIYTYIAREEEALRANPLGMGSQILGNILGE